MVRPRTAFVLGSTMCVLGAIASCRDATQVVIEARTNVAHRAGLVTAFTVGLPETVENAPSTTETNEPWGPDGFIGSLVSIPGGEKDGPLAVKLVMGVNREARDCLPPKYEGCIVARRKLRYLPHERLRLPIALYAQCEGVPCDQDTTCNALGQCVSASVDPNACTTPEGCTVPGDLPPDDVTPDAAPPPRDAAAEDAISVADALPDAVPEASTDGSTDAKIDVSESGAPTPRLVDCPGSLTGPCNLDQGVTCCWDAATKMGACQTNCSMGGADDGDGLKRINCDDDSDCTAGDSCCRVPAAPVTICQMGGCMGYYPVCHATGTCPMGMSCTVLSFQHYRTCL